MTVREESLRWITQAIEEERPHERLPRQLAEELLHTAESEEVPAEDLARWIHLLPTHVEISVIACERWARVYHFERAMEKQHQEGAEC